jgi:hypothetical protein
MLSIKTLAGTLSAWFAITFVLCVGWCGVAPDGWHARELLEILLPGFVWLTAGSFLLGLVESALFGAYSGALFAALYNAVAKAGGQHGR